MKDRVQARPFRKKGVRLTPCGGSPVPKLRPALTALIGLALAQSGSPSAAAKMIGVSLRKLRARMREYGLMEAAR